MYKLENPNNMWTVSDNGVYTTPVFAAGAPNPLFNSLPNSPYLTTGQQLQYMGFLEGRGGPTTFATKALFVLLSGKCQVNNVDLTARNATFASKITCEQGAIVLVFIPRNIGEQLLPLVQAKEKIIANAYITKYRIWGQKLGENIFFQSWSGLDYTYHAFTQMSEKNVARGAHAADFFHKNLIVHHGEIIMKTYFPDNATIVETRLCKTDDFYEGYDLSGFAYHSFKAITNTLDTMLVERAYGNPPKCFPLRALFGEDIICAERDGCVPDAEQTKAVKNALTLTL